MGLALVWSAGGPGGAARAAEPMEFIRVSSDGWNFETARTHQRFIPFGANLVFAYQGASAMPSLNLLTQPKWDPATIRRAFEGARLLHMNLMKVFLTTPEILPDPQTNDRVALAPLTPPLFERLDTLFQIAHDNHIYISLTLAEWGMAGSRWFHDGGIFFGRQKEDGPGIDSFAVYRNFWKVLAERTKHEPALFSYNLAVEYTIPEPNWGAQKPDWRGKHAWFYQFNNRWGRLNWQRWLGAQYGGLGAIDAAWKTAYPRLEEIPQPQIAWNGTAYTLPQAMIADYNSFKEWTSYRFLKNQADAIRAVDRGHMITAGMLPQHPALGWKGSALYHAGILNPELDFLDYTTVHIYTHPDDRKPGHGPFTRALHEGLLEARFAYYPGKPVIAEELGHHVPDFRESLTESLALVHALAGQVSGYQLWLLSDAGHDFGPLDQTLRPNAWGREWMKLAGPGGAVATLPRRRAPAQTTFKLVRLGGEAPIEDSAANKLLLDWDGVRQPVDFDWPLNPAIAQLHKESAAPHEHK